MENEKRYIEAALFVSSKPLSLAELRTLTGIGAVGYVQKLVEELKNEYATRGSAIEILELDGKYEMRVKNEYIDRVKEFAQDAEIGHGALRVLAFISKHDGILKSEVVKRMGSQAYGYIKELVEAEFVKQQKSGRSSKLLLTEKFRRYFKINAEEKQQ
ncbi:MAG: SMC-Scp complex subunit ScpB [Candidatus Bilamarchaeaceae archaeon]